MGDRRTAACGRRLERAGLIRGKVLDVGCGTGEHTILLTGLGYDVLGIDFAPSAVEQARRNADAKGVGRAVRGRRRDEPCRRAALRHHPRQRAVPHLRRRRPGAIRRAACTARACPAASCTCSRCPTRAAASGRRSASETIRDAFGDGWELEALEPATYRGVVSEVHAEAIGLPVGTPRRRARVAGQGPPPLNGHVASSIAGVGDGEPWRTQRAQARQHVGRRGRRGRRRGWRPPARVSSAIAESSSRGRGVESSSSSRSTVRSTLAATRAWKLTPGHSVASRTSLSRKSATAATSSAAVGRP